jgi:hypothetical protein
MKMAKSEKRIYLDVCALCRPFDDLGLIRDRHTRGILRPGGCEVKEASYLSEDEMVRRAVAALMKVLGPVETVRFLTLPRGRRLDSVRRHQEWQRGLDLKSFFDQVLGGNPG